MNNKKRMIVAGVFFTLMGTTLFTNPMNAKANEYTPKNWVARSVQEVKSDLAKHETNHNYLLVWGDTLSVISQATGVPIQTLVDTNEIANRDFILAGDSIYLSAVSTEHRTWSSINEAISFYEANIRADNEPDVAEVALGSEFYQPKSWKLIENSGDIIVLSINNSGIGGKDIIEFVKGKSQTTMTIFAADSSYPERPTSRQTVRNSDKVTIKREELNPIDPS